MEETQNPHRLFDGFSPISTEDWEAQINKDLKGADYEKKLVWKTLEGFNLKPYYRKEDLLSLDYLATLPAEFPYVRGNKSNTNEWEIRQDFKVEDPKDTNTSILEALKKGATSIGVHICGKKVKSPEDFTAVIDGIDLTVVPVHFKSGKASARIAGYLIDNLKSQGLDKNKIKGSFNHSPIDHLTTNGSFYTSEVGDLNSVIDFVKLLNTSLPTFKAVGIDGASFANAGTSIVQEVAFSLSMAVEYLDLLTNAGVSIDVAAKSIQFKFGIGGNYFLEIAKLRAARLLWAKIVEGYKPAVKASSEMFVHSETSTWNKTVYDVHVNILRATTEAMSAILGGTNSLTVKPFDEASKKESGFSNRIARNLQVVLKEEAYFDKIVDPAAGSYYIENATNNITEKTWELFLQIEDKGGYLKALKEGLVNKLVNETAEKRKGLIANRREVLLGTNQFSNADETISDKVGLKIRPVDESCADNLEVQTIKSYRGGYAFEQLRLRTEKHSKRPKVFMLSMGNLAMRKARASFSTNFFACAGYEVIDNLGFESVEKGLKAASNAGSDIVVVCSSDDEYAELVPEVNEQLKDKAIVVVAGAPACMDDLKSKGIEHFIHMRTNLLESLTQFHQLLGIN